MSELTATRPGGPVGRPAIPPAGDHLAPVDVFVVAFPSRTFRVPDVGRLLDLVAAGMIILLDVEFVEADATGVVRRLSAAELSASVDGDLTIWEGASSGLLDEADLEVLASTLEPGNVAIVVLYENVWLLDVLVEWGAHGGRLVADGGIPHDALLAALDATEPMPVEPADQEAP